MRRNACWGMVTVIVATIVCGCTWNTYHAKSGTGDAQAPRAVFKPEKNVAISNIDGKRVFVTARNWWVPVATKTMASVMPGKHTLVIKYAQAGWSSLGCRVTIDAQPGKAYTVKAKRLPADGSQGFKAVKNPQMRKIVVWVEDVETGSKVIDETACEPVTS